MEHTRVDNARDALQRASPAAGKLLVVNNHGN